LISFHHSSAAWEVNYALLNLHPPRPTAPLPQCPRDYPRNPLHPPIPTRHIPKLVRLPNPLLRPAHRPCRWWRCQPNRHSSSLQRTIRSALLPHFNPVSIVWRWYAIADRRLRACNAVFWNSEKARWDGSEDIMLRSRVWISKAPGLSYVPLVSTSSLMAVVVILQGVQASFIIFAALHLNSTYSFGRVCRTS
jgi:hypothetical protein